jgi:hypothetical protein
VPWNWCKKSDIFKSSWDIKAANAVVPSNFEAIIISPSGMEIKLCLQQNRGQETAFVK